MFSLSAAKVTGGNPEKMSLLVFSTKTNAAEKRFLRVTELLLLWKELIICRTINELSDELRQPHLNPRIVILFASTKKELNGILSIREFLADTKIILILPDTNPATIARGHALRPSYLSTCKTDFVDIAAVLGKMIKNCSMTYVSKIAEIRQ